MPKILSATKHFQVTKQLRADIKKLEPNDLVPTAAELEQRYNSSHATIIRALTSLRRDGVIYRPAGQKRYQVAEFTAKPLARIVIARPQYPSADLDNIVRMIVLEGQKQHLAFDFKHFMNMSELDLNMATEGRDALVLLPSPEDFPEHIVQALTKPRKPAVIISQHLNLPHVSNVTIADEELGKIAVQHLQSLGHTQNLIVLDQAFDSTIETRLNGWRKQMAKIIEADAITKLIFDSEIKPFDDAREVTYQHFKSMLQSKDKPNFSAVFCTSMCGAQAVIRACFELNIRIPEDLSLIAYAGESNSGAYIIPPLTTIETDISSMGQRVCDQLLTLLNNKKPQPMHVQMPVKVNGRQTTQPRTNCKHSGH